MNPHRGARPNFQNLVAQVPELIQPFIVMLAAAIPFLEGEGAPPSASSGDSTRSLPGSRGPRVTSSPCSSWSCSPRAPAPPSQPPTARVAIRAGPLPEAAPPPRPCHAGHAAGQAGVEGACAPAEVARALRRPGSQHPRPAGHPHPVRLRGPRRGGYSAPVGAPLAGRGDRPLDDVSPRSRSGPPSPFLVGGVDRLYDHAQPRENP